MDLIELIESAKASSNLRDLIKSSLKKLSIALNEYVNALNLSDKYLRLATSHLIGRGKLFRGLYTYLISIALNASESKAITLAVAGELYHTASLIHDDIIDRSPIRRGIEAVHVKYGVNRAILAGDLLIVYPNLLLSKLGSKVIELLSLAGIELCDGESLELNYNLNNINLDIYNRIAYKKTAALFEYLFKAASVIANKLYLMDMLGKLGVNVGMAFQYRDDMLDIIGNSKVLGKPVHMDVNKPNLIYVLKKEYKTSIEDALKIAMDMIDIKVSEATSIIDELPISARFKEVLKILTYFLKKRSL